MCLWTVYEMIVPMLIVLKGNLYLWSVCHCGALMNAGRSMNSSHIPVAGIGGSVGFMSDW